MPFSSNTKNDEFGHAQVLRDIENLYLHLTAYGVGNGESIEQSVFDGVSQELGDDGIVGRTIPRRLEEIANTIKEFEKRILEAVAQPIRLTVGRGNLVYTPGLIYGSKAGYNPTSVAGAMWDSGTKSWVIADSTWTDGICYAYTDTGTVVAVAQRFNGVSGAVSNAGALIEGAIIYSQTITTYALGGDILTIYLVDGF